MTTFVLLSSALCLECDNRSYLTVDTARQHVCRELSTSAQHATSFSLAGAATPTVEREQMIGHARHENCDIHTLSTI